MASLNDLRARIADELDRTDLAAQINREINTAIKHYETTRMRFNEVREQEFDTTVIGTRTYSLPSNFIKFDSLKIKYNDSFITMRPITWQQMEDEDRQITATQGVPEYYTVYATTIRLFPVPNGAYTLVGSYVRNYSAVSLTGSATSTASANVAQGANGWVGRGEELIRHRARASVQIHYLKDPAAIAEMRQLAAQKMPYLCQQERVAYQSLTDHIGELASTGLLRPARI